MDDAQFIERGWIHRNRIKGPNGEILLTIPIDSKGSTSREIAGTKIRSDGWGTKRHWQARHWMSMRSCYAKAPFWDRYAPFFEAFYTDREWCWLVDAIDVQFDYLVKAFGLSTEFVVSSKFGFEGAKSDLVLDHCRKLGGSICVAGELGRDYIDVEKFSRAGVSVFFDEYAHPSYPQRFPPFVERMSCIDLLMNCGPQSLEVMMDGNIRKEELIGLRS